MRRWSRGILALCVVAGLAASVCISRDVFAHSPFSHAGKAPATGIAPGISSNLATCGSHWSVVASPDTGTQNANQLNGIAAVSASDIWAVGYDWTGIGYDGTGITEQWNGYKWSVVASPQPGNLNTFLYGVTAISSNDVWAVGSYLASGGQYTPFIEQWNGTSWNQVSTGVSSGYLYGISADAANDIWAVGWYLSPNGFGQTLILHYDGSRWSQVTSVNPLPNDVLNGVSARSISDVWAVGFADSGGADRTLIEHWDGMQWSAVASPNGGTGENLLNAVSAVSASGVWAVGHNDAVGQSTVLIEQWNGSAWNIVSSPSLGANTASPDLLGIAAISPSDVWAVGTFESTVSGSPEPYLTLTEHWNGAAWSIIPAGNPGYSYNTLRAVAAISSNSVWAAGTFANQGRNAGNTLVERYPGLFIGVQGAPGARPLGPGSAFLCP